MTEIILDGPRTGITILLAHGAGAPMDHPWMNQLTQQLVDNGLQVGRFEFPYMAARRDEGGKKPPNREPILRQTWLDVIEKIGNPSELVIGGKSMGGRIATMVSDEARVAGCVCFGYPFHPPGRPEKLRTAHLEQLKTRTLIIQGSRDVFGTFDDVQTYKLSRKIQLHWIEDGDHGLKPCKKVTGRTEADSLAEAAKTAAVFVQNWAAPNTE